MEPSGFAKRALDARAAALPSAGAALALADAVTRFDAPGAYLPEIPRKWLLLTVLGDVLAFSLGYSLLSRRESPRLSPVQSRAASRPVPAAPERR